MDEVRTVSEFGEVGLSGHKGDWIQLLCPDYIKWEWTYYESQYFYKISTTSNHRSIKWTKIAICSQRLQNSAELLSTTPQMVHTSRLIDRVNFLLFFYFFIYWKLQKMEKYNIYKHQQSNTIKSM